MDPQRSSTSKSDQQTEPGSYQLLGSFQDLRDHRELLLPLKQEDWGWAAVLLLAEARRQRWQAPSATELWTHQESHLDTCYLSHEPNVSEHSGFSRRSAFNVSFRRFMNNRFTLAASLKAHRKKIEIHNTKTRSEIVAMNSNKSCASKKRLHSLSGLLLETLLTCTRK